MSKNFLKKKKQYSDNHPSNHWKGMPEYICEDLMPCRQIIVSFETEEDVQEFAKLLDQKINLKTKSLWFPKHSINRIEDLRYVEK